MKLLSVQADVDIGSKDKIGMTTVTRAAKVGYGAVLKLSLGRLDVDRVQK